MAPQIQFKCRHHRTHDGHEDRPRVMWLTRDNDFRITQRDHSTKEKEQITFITVKLTRLLAFFADPTDDNWDTVSKLTLGAGVTHMEPFLHFCHYGHASAEANRGPGCVNGIDHGTFGTVSVNNAMRTCAVDGKNRSTCPGHGALRYFYVQRDGRPRPCFNLPAGPREDCRRPIKCF